MKQDVTAELYYGGVWNDATDADEVYSVRKPIEITRGRDSEDTALSPASTGLSLKSVAGKYNPRNPTSPLYGAVGRNTPARIHLGVPHVGAAASNLVASTSHIAPSVDAPTSSGILICAWSGPFPSGSYTPPGSMTESLDQNDSVQTMMVARQVISGAGATGTRTATSSLSETWLACSVLIHGPSAITTGAAGIAGNQLTVDGNAGDWWVLIASSGWDDSDITPSAYPWDTDGGGWILLADTGAVNSGDADAAFNQMKIWAKQVKTTDTAHTVAVVEPTGLLSTILYFTRVPAGEIDSVWSMRFHGEASSWAPKRTLSPNVTPWTDIEVSGILRRLGQGTPPAHSALRRWIAGTNPVAYWSMTEGVTSTSAQLTLGSGQPIKRTDLLVNKGVMAPGEGTLGAWHEPSVKLNGNVVAGADVFISATSGRIVIDHVQRHGIAPDNTFQLTLYDDDASTSFGIYWNSLTSLTDVGVKFRDGGVQVSDTSASLPRAFDGSAHHYRLDIDQNGANIDWVLYLDGVSVVSHTETSVTLPNFAFVELAFTEAAATDEISLGHIAIWNVATPPAITDAAKAAFGYPGEQAGVRFLRVCAEEGITCAVKGNPNDTQPMGPQFSDTLLSLLHEIEATDDGFIFDAREFPGLVMRTGRSLYNQGVALAIDYDAFQLAPTTDPVLDDLYTHNDVTASRREGGSARAVQETGPLNVNEPSDDPEGVGRNTHQVPVNVFSDLVLPDVASWHLHRGTVDETRWPRVTVDLDASPAIAGAASAIDVGDRITIVNHPDSADTISLIVLGCVETIESHRRRITFTCMPESPFHIAEVGTVGYRLAGSSATYRRTGTIDSTQTTITLRVEEGPDWVNENGFNIMIGGELMNVTAVAAATGTYPLRSQQFTVIRSVNGVVKSHPNNVRVELADPPHIGL